MATDKQRRGRAKKANRIAEKFFGGVPAEQLPTADQLLRALMAAKGERFAISPQAIAAIRAGGALDVPDCSVHQGDVCTLPMDVCVVCDHPEDNCNLCDWEDCLPVGPDPGPT